MDLKDELISEEGVSLVGKEPKGPCSWGAKRLGKGERGLARQQDTHGKVGILLHVESEDLEGIRGPAR